ncbi:MAG: IS6 family transposase [Pseudomonadales bacterium]
MIVSYETIRQWCLKFGLDYAKKLRSQQSKLGDTWYMDDVFIAINGKRQYLWRAVDQDGDIVDILVQSRRNKKAALRFFRNILKRQGAPRKIVTDKSRSYGAARKNMMPSVMHCQDRYANNRAEESHRHTRQQERKMRRFKSPGHAQRFLSIHSRVRNLFHVGRHLLKACHYRMFRTRAFDAWQEVTCAC